MRHTNGIQVLIHKKQHKWIYLILFSVYIIMWGLGVYGNTLEILGLYFSWDKNKSYVSVMCAETILFFYAVNHNFD